MAARWSLAQFCVWIATGNETLANSLPRRCSISEAGRTVFEGHLTSSQPKAIDKITPDADFDAETWVRIAWRQLVWDALEKLLDALRNNRLIAIGRANGGDMVQITPTLWLGLTLCDEEPYRGITARPENRLNFRATWFGEITLAIDDVLRVWPRMTRTLSGAGRERAFNDFVKQNPDATRTRAEQELGKLGVPRREVREVWQTHPAAPRRKPGRPKK
jgi:hypothetical protein